MKKLELYYFPQCPYCQIVMSALRVTGLENEVVFYDVNEDHHKKEELIKLTGRGTVPVLFIDGKPMRESKDIAAWIHSYSKMIQDGPGKEERSGN